MSSDSQMFGFQVTPEMMGRLIEISREIRNLLEERTNSPEEAMVVLDQVTRILAKEYGFSILMPLTEGSLTDS